MTSRICLVEDEPDIRQLVSDYLSNAGFAVDVFGDGEQAMQALSDWHQANQLPDLIILDVMLPGLDGLAICQQLRTFTQTPVIFVTARHDEIDRLLGLRLGADDYVCKPFSPRELVARVEAILRRQQWLASQPVPVQVTGLHLDSEALRASLDGQPLDLTPVEFRLLTTLVAHPGRVFRRDQLVDVAYEDYRVVSDRTIDSHIKNLRLKLNKARDGQHLIQSVYGVGYRFEPDTSIVSP